MRWTIWCIGFFGAMACVAGTAVSLIRGDGHWFLWQAGVFFGVGLFMLADPHRRRTPHLRSDR